ncbi:hypothetical protein [Arthrobacter sp. 260]|uniref:hypothetical protein n=1 Tax=Arthrobacter sp. 260 TaxID=2735314 RepID=UPI0014923248|nr:hypothetical protein [Arthrobacter sp. 260]NOJ60961.1 hypothetical protein [Arthrobacter sp. 260]
MSDVSPDENHRNPFTRPGFIISAALVLALIAAVIVIAFIPRGGDEPDAGLTEPTSTETTSAPSATAAGAEESICGLPASEDTALGAAPESDWELLGTMAVPEAPDTAGPGVVDESGIRTCFAQTPTGALYAASNIFATMIAGDPVDLYEKLVADSEARDEALEALTAEVQNSPGTNDESFQIQGFQLDRYSETNATVTLAFQVENGSVGSITLPLVWGQGDWKLLIEQSGAPEPRQLNDLSDFISWSGI